MLKEILGVVIITAVLAAIFTAPGAIIVTSAIWMLVKVGVFAAPNWYFIVSIGIVCGAIIGAIIGASALLLANRV